MKAKDCVKCKKKAEQRLIDKQLCNDCFCNLVEKKIKKNLRKYGIQKNNVLIISDDACEFVIKKILKMPVVIKKMVTNKNTDFIIAPFTMDDDNELLLTCLFENQEIIKDSKKIVKLFYPVSTKDIKEYFKIQNAKIKYEFKESKITKMLDRIEAKHVGTKTALLKSVERIKSVNSNASVVALRSKLLLFIVLLIMQK